MPSHAQQADWLMTEDDDQTGFRRPPKGTRFKPGRSGNPKGRPKGRRNLTTDLAALMKKRIPIRKDGELRHVTGQEALLLRLFEKAVGGDLKASAQIFAMVMKRITENRLYQNLKPLATKIANCRSLSTPQRHLSRTGSRAMIQIAPAERDAIFRSNFPAFLQASFHALEPNKTFEPNWLQEAISELLVQSQGKQTHAFISAPPRSLKSFQVSVVWVAFKLGHDPTHKFICASYSRDLANYLGAQCRKLMQADLYCRLFKTRLQKITEDELVTTDGGYRLTTSVGSTLTGLGGDTLIVDDPLNASDAYSETQRKTVNTWFTDTLSSRSNDKRTATIFVVSQRLHQEDLTGMLIEKGWKRSCLSSDSTTRHFN
jgi:hypothetical protein